MIVPTQVGTGTAWKQVNAGNTHTLAIQTNGTLWGWGNGNYGMFGTGATGYITYQTPMQIGTDTDWKWVDAGNQYSTALKTNGTLWAWGANNYGTR